MSKPTIPSLAIVILTVALSACQEEKPRTEVDNNNSATLDYREIQIDASDRNTWSYIDLVQGTSVTQDDTWHIAMQRYNIIVNHSIDVALLADQSSFYSDDTPIESMFINASPSSEVSKLTQNYNWDNVSFATPSTRLITEANGKTFYNYQFTNHKLYANSEAFWVIRSSNGTAYAKLRPVMLFDDEVDAYEKAAFDLYIQSNGENNFSNEATRWEIQLTNNIGSGCFDIDTKKAISCSGNNWDIQFNFNPSAYVFNLKLNSGVSGSGSTAALSSGAFNWADHDKITAGIQSHADPKFSITQFHYGQDSQESAFTTSPWYEYGLQGGHGIWPNYRVYAIKDESSIFALQLINYYNAQAQSGHITLRYKTID